MDPNIGLWFCRGIIIVCAITVALATFGTHIFTSKIDKAKDKKIEKLVDGNNELLSQNKELLSKIETYQVDLEKKEEKIKQLEIEAKKASRGISSIYDFNGAKRVGTGPGQVFLEAGQEVTVFQNMIQLEKAKSYVELLRVCDEQIQKTPEWLTPYLFSGVAYANLGYKEKAIIKLEYVLEKAPGDPAYLQASNILKSLKEDK